LPLEWGLLLWHFVCIFLLLLACWRLGQSCFQSARAAFGAAALVAGLLTIPVAGTALYIMDQYLNTRSFSTAMVMWIVVASLEKKYLQAAGWLALTVLIHPLMAVFGFVFSALLFWKQKTAVNQTKYAAVMLLFPLGLFPPVSEAYRQVLDSHPYFSLLRWEWYEWLGIFGPILILFWIGRFADRKGLTVLRTLCWAAVLFGTVFFAIALVVSVAPPFARFLELQPMRSLHLLYILLFAISGGLLGEYVLQTRLWRWLAVSLPLSAGMFYAQRQLFPSTSHIEWPGTNSRNAWVDAFAWIRQNTPVNAYFALDPEHMRLPREDQHGFRAIADRSMLADAVKDSGAVTMFPALAQSWLEQTRSQQGWKDFTAADFERLRQKYGVGWLVLQQAQSAGLECPYQNSAVLVCRIPSPGDSMAK
jgi:hypothetical protein